METTTKPTIRDNTSDFRSRLVRECLAMAQYALGAGHALPGGAAQVLDGVSLGCERLGACTASGDSVKAAAVGGADWAGRAQPERFPRTIQLLAVHERLSQIVAPATPYGILLLSEHATRSSVWAFLGPIPLVRRMMLAAFLSLALFLGIGLFSVVGANSADIFEGHGVTLFLNELFLLAAAGLGASFAALFKANRYIVEASYDPKHEPSYWIRFGLGVIAGIIFAELIPITSLTNGGQPAAEAAQAVDRYVATTEGHFDAFLGGIARPTLAMLGGFSSTVVYRILDRSVSAIDSLFRGETWEIVAAQKQAVKARLAEQAVQNRMETLAQLVALQQQIGDGVEPAALKKSVATILSDYMSTDLLVSASALEGSPTFAVPREAENASAR